MPFRTPLGPFKDGRGLRSGFFGVRLHSPLGLYALRTESNPAPPPRKCAVSAFIHPRPSALAQKAHSRSPPSYVFCCVLDDLGCLKRTRCAMSAICLAYEVRPVDLRLLEKVPLDLG